MNTTMQNSKLLTQNLNCLIRTYADDAVLDAKALATRILAPVNSELDRATHKFSVDLFATVTLHIVFNIEDSTLKDVLDYIEYPHPQSEGELLDRITQNSGEKVKNNHVRAWFKAFKAQRASISVGISHRMVLRCYAQWCKAFNLPCPAQIHTVMDLAIGKNLPDNMSELKLEVIRIGTRYELSDAVLLIKIILGCVKDQTDDSIFRFASEWFIAISLLAAHEMSSPNLRNLDHYHEDPAWDSYRQIILYIQNCDHLCKSRNTKTADRMNQWADKVLAMPHGALANMIKRSHVLWLKAINYKLPESDTEAGQFASPAIPPNSIQIFKMVEISEAVTRLNDMRDDRRCGGERLLEKAQKYDGYRILPDAKKASLFLEQSKKQFENLVEPINRLQLDLTLCASMEPSKFRVTPILLLGDPGIGKTHLAMELAKGLGGTMERLSAGGAQGGFQLNGSHPSWNTAKFGQVIKAMAEGETTSPVFVIDEVDKIGSDERYPLLPVLLDLLEPGTARNFKDEFFEMQFDASRIICIMTANSLDTVPEALRSRVEIYDIPRPEPAQRLRIIHDQAKALREETHKNIKLDKATTHQLADQTEIDLRKTVRIVREAFTKAIVENAAIARLILPTDTSHSGRSKKAAYHRNEIGFVMS